jgi:hypothetical protein
MSNGGDFLLLKVDLSELLDPLNAGGKLSSYIDLLLATYPSARVWLTPSEQEKGPHLSRIYEIRAQQIFVEPDDKSEI